MSTETLNWQSFISDWRFVSGGENPPEGLAESVVPAVTRSSDGLFEITTISFGFSGTAPYHQQKFTAAFSFSVSEAVNFYEVSVSSDDTAIVQLGGVDFVSSRLNAGGIASSAWSDTAGNLPAVSGTFETIGGPYSLSVTITLKRLIGAKWVVSEAWTESDPYEIKTARLSFSGNARSDTLGFSWDSLPLEIDGGSWVEISVEADDEATVSVGDYLVRATLNNPARYDSGWIEKVPNTFPISVSYRNAGGPYRLSVTITVKRSLREVYFETFLNTPDELMHVPEYSEEELKGKLAERNVFGVSEVAYVRLRHKYTKKLLGTPDSWAESYDLYKGEVCAKTSLLPKNGESERECQLIACFDDGEEIPLKFTIKYPTHETVKKLTEEEFVNFLRWHGETEEQIAKRRIDYKGNPYYDGNYYLITVHPTDVSFAYLYFWENEHPEEKSGLFLEPGLDTAHLPAEPCQLYGENQWTDCAFYAANFSDDTIESAIVSEAGDVGVLKWVCPVRWSMNNPGEEGQNSMIRADGCLPDRVQTMTLYKNQTPPPLLTVVVKKVFGNEYPV